MSNEKELPNGMKLVFAPGCFDNFDGTQEELDALIKEIEESFISGAAFEEATPFEELDDAELAELLEMIDTSENKTLQ